MAVLNAWLGCAVLLAVLLSPLLAADQAKALSEAQVRAGMVYNFASFTDWPDAAPIGQPLVIGVLGNDAIAKALRTIGKLPSGRDIDVRIVTQGEGLAECRVLYVSAIADRAVAATLASVDAMSVLTVGEHERFLQLGGIIRVYASGKRLKFEVDVAHAIRVRLKISSRVLDIPRLAKDSDASNP